MFVNPNAVLVPMDQELNSSKSYICLNMIIILNKIKFDVHRPASEVYKCVQLEDTAVKAKFLYNIYITNKD